VRFVSWLVSTAVALAVAAWLFEGIWFAPRHGDAADKIVPLLVVAVILGAVSSFVKPVLQILSIPFIILTLGLFLLVINAAMLGLTAWLAGVLGIGFHVDGFWAAVGGAIVITVVGWVMDGLIGADR
jgi:putative membrane protein